MPDAEEFTDLHFPKAGINVVSAFGKQPPRQIDPEPNVWARTTPVGLNVRGYEARQARVRGGSRGGLVKWLDEQVNDAVWVVQDAELFVTTVPRIIQGVEGYWPLDGDLTDQSGHKNDLLAEPSPSPAYGTGIIGQALVNGGGFITPLPGMTDLACAVSAWFYATAGTGNGGGTGFGRGTEVGDGLRIAYRGDGAHGKIVVRNRGGTDIIATGFTLSFGTWHQAALSFDGTANTVTLYVDGALVGSAAYTLSGGLALTYGISTVGADFTSPLDQVVVWNRTITAAEETLMYEGGDGFLNLGRLMQLSQSGRIVTLVAVSQGEVKVWNSGDTTWTATTNNTGETPPLNYTGVLYSSANNQLLFFVDGINYVYYKPTTNSVELWSTSVTAGTLPKDVGNNYGRLICTWRGRTVISGLLQDPQNWFMSAVSDPFNWDYAPTSATPSQAVAGNNSPLGFVGDVITTLVPYNDDVLIFGGDHTIYMMRGDPMAGGQIDRVSDVIGMAWGQGSWCKDPYGNVYFISNRCGVYVLTPGSQPVRISQAIEPLLQDLDMGRNLFNMVWDDRLQGFHLFVTWVDEPKATTHFFFEQRTSAWWTDSFADDDMNPLCCTTFDGNDPDDRRILIGCWDGYVRQFDPQAEDDDGTPIGSEVWIGPLVTANFDEILLKDIQAVLGETSNDVAYAVYVGPTAEAALDADPISTGTFGPGRNLTSLVRFSGHAVYLKLSSSRRWAMEAVRARIVTQGKVRRRGA